MTVWVREHYDDVFRFCARRVGEDRASDATQESFVIAQQSTRRFDGSCTPRTWLFGIAHNVCRNLVRKHRREFLVAHEVLLERSTEPTAFDALVLRQALNALSPEHREVVVMHEVEGMRYKEIGEILGIPEGTVKSRLYHAVQKLRQSLTAEEARP
jgi:RNA polymerase sigma-70 factor (ECF subfamily)